MPPLIFIVFVRLEYSPGRSVHARSLDGSVLAAGMLADQGNFFIVSAERFQKRLMLRRVTLLKQAMPLAHGRLVQAGFTEKLDPLGFGHVGVWHNALLLLIGTGVG